MAKKKTKNPKITRKNSTTRDQDGREDVGDRPAWFDIRSI